MSPKFPSYKNSLSLQSFSDKSYRWGNSWGKAELALKREGVV